MVTSTEGSQASFPRLEARLSLLEQLAPAAIDVVCLDETFALAPIPQSIAKFGFVERAWGGTNTERPIESVKQEQRARVLGLLGQARTTGMASGNLHFEDVDETFMMHVVNLIDELGVYVFVRGGQDVLGTTGGGIAVPPRRLVQHRDASARFLWVDSGTTVLLGWSSETLKGKGALDLIHPDDAERAIDSWLMMAAGAETQPMRLRYRDTSGAYRWFEAHNKNYLDDPERGYVETELIDIDSEMGALARARESELHFAALTESLPIGVIQIDGSGEIAFANGWMKELAGLDGEELPSLQWVHIDDREFFADRIQQTLGALGDQECDLRVVDRFDQPKICRARLRLMPSSHGDATVIASFEDVTASRDIQAQLREQALHDELTGLSNRRGLYEWLNNHRETFRKRGVAVFFVDLDDFKLVNDVKGHAAGDEILVAIAAELAALVRPEDHVSRIGGDEFVIVCPGITEPAAAGDVARRIVDSAARPFIFDDDVVWLGCSVGIASALPNQPSVDRLISDADVAMYEAKRAGGRTFAFFDEKQRRGVERRLRVENELRVALSEGQLELYLQPVVNLVTGKTVSAEALVRWNHPDLALVAPAQFIPAAERTGMIHMLGAWILDEACRLAATWPGGRIAVNISPPQLAKEGFVDLVRSAIARHGIEPSALVLEVTETVFLDMNENTVMALAELVETGVRVALDDFGTGFSSLNHLRQIPAQVVKVDRSYIADLGIDAGTTAIVKAMVGLTNSFGQELVAEGIETEEQATLLREMGVTLGQGFLLGRPLPAEVQLSQIMAGSPTPRGSK